MSKNIKVEIGGIDVTDYLVKAELVTTYGDTIASYYMDFTKNVNGAVEISNALTVEVWLDSNTPPTTQVFNGFVDLFMPEDGLIRIVAKDQLALLINKQVMHEYDSSVPNDAAYPNGKISNIFADLVVTYGGLSTLSSGATITCQDSGTDIVLSKFVCRNADPFERCKKLAETLNWVFYYKASDGYVYFEPKNQTTNPNVLEVGTNIVELPKWEYDRSELINDLRLEGAQQLVQGTQIFTGDASTTIFTLSETPVSIAVYYSAAKDYSTTAKLANEIQIGEISGTVLAHDYEVDKKKKTVNFVSFVPANSANNVLAEVSYYAPIPIHMENAVSKGTYGNYEKTVVLTDVITLDDAWKRAENILDKYSQPFKSAKLKVKWDDTLSATVGQSIKIIDSINEPNVDDYFTIYKISDDYPNSIVEMEVGDKQYTIEEYQSNVLERVKRLEETVIGPTNAVSEIVQNKVYIGIATLSTTVLIQNIEDSFIIGHPDNGKVGTSMLGNRTTTSSTITYEW